jgi:hypothetical protein
VRAPKPVALSDEKAMELTEKFKADGSSVWNVQFIKKPLLDSSHGKCAYCETRLDEESKYMEVEHFKDKKDFPEDVVSWENLLPSCKRCNGRKLSHNVVRDGMIIDPYEVEPKNHIYLKNFRIRWRDDIGKRTVEVLYLNDSDRLVRVRFLIGEYISQSLEVVREGVERYIGGQNSVAERNKILSGIKNLLLECQPSAQFSSISATTLLSDQDYIWIKEQLKHLGMWAEFEELEAVAVLLNLEE